MKGKWVLIQQLAGLSSQQKGSKVAPLHHKQFGQRARAGNKGNKHILYDMTFLFFQFHSVVKISVFILNLIFSEYFL